MTIRFYSWPRSSGTRVQWCLEELGLSYEHVVLDRSKNEHRAPAYLAVNPNGKVPALVDDGVTWFEGAAIVMHLGEKYGVERGLWPASGQARADAMSWTTWIWVELLAYGLQSVYHGLDSPVSYQPADRSAAAAAYTLMNYQRMLDMIEERLADREYLLGTFSLVDACAAHVVAFIQRLGSSETRPRVAAWLKRCVERPARSRAQ